MEDGKSIPLYPFNGRSKNLIDKFYIFGYNYITIKKYIIDNDPQISEYNLNKDGLGIFKLGEEPSTLSEITHDFNKLLSEPKQIKKLIFPNSLYIFYRVDNEINSEYFNEDLEKGDFSKIDLSEERLGCPTSFRSVFSSKPLEGKNSIKCQNGFAYTFYRKLLINKKIRGKRYIFYVPYTFCIISEYPFYKSFESIFRNIRIMFSQPTIYIPIEILLYKLITLTPSPINTDVILDLDLMINQSAIFSTKIPIANKKFNVYSIEENQILQKRTQSFSLPLNETKIKFKYLSGYPLIQYNLAKVLFHTLSIEDIITVFISTFFESNIIFFSTNNEYLTLTINAYGNFNYPLNDAEYFYNIGAISLEAFRGDDEFGIKNSSSIIGINNEYVENYLSNTNIISEHIVVDLDKGKVQIKEGNRNNDDNGDTSFNEIIQLIRNICRKNHKYKYLEETKVYKAINNLYKRLLEIKGKKEKYFSNTSFKDYNQFTQFIGFNYEPYIGSIDELNKLIQEAFYECLITLSLYFYENFVIQSKDNNIQNMEIQFNKQYKNNIKYIKEDLLIIEQLKDSMKFIGSFTQFVMCHNPIDLFKIPLTFTDELLSIFAVKKYDPKAINIKYFDLIDKLYLTKKLKDIIEIDFNSDIHKYIANFKKIFDREIQENDKNIFNDDSKTLIKIFDYQDKKILKYKTYELDERILIKYIHIINNLEEGKYVVLISNIFFEEENLLKEIYITEIETSLEQYFIENDYLSINEQCIANIIILFIINLKFLPENFEFNDSISSLLQIFNPFRKFIFLIVQTVYKLYKQSLEEKNYKMTERWQLCFYACFNHIRNKNIVPNENLIFIIHKFFEEDKDINRENKLLEEDDKISKEYNFYINEDNLNVHYNFTSNKFYSEKYIFNLVNTEEKSFFNIKGAVDFEIFSPKIRYVKKNEDYIESLFRCQKELYGILSKQYNEFNKNLDFNKLDKDYLLDSCLNLLIFIRNNNDFVHLDEIKHIIENIFYIYYDK